MTDFLRRNWLYIAGPLALILVALAVFLACFSDGTPDTIYRIY
jgi:hypothetical protein